MNRINKILVSTIVAILLLSTVAFANPVNLELNGNIKGLADN